MEIKIKNFLGRERFQWSGGDANQLYMLFGLTIFVNTCYDVYYSTW